MKPTNDKADNFNFEESMIEMNSLAYERGIGAFKPHFQGIAQSYYPLTCTEVFLSFVILILTIGTGLGIMIGFIFWAISGLETYVIVWIAVLLAFMLVTIILFYVGGKNRRKMQKQLIKESNRKQQQMMKNKR